MRTGSVDTVDKVFITVVDKGVDFNHLLMYSSRRNNGAPCSRSGQAMKLGGLESFTLSPVLLPTVYGQYWTIARSAGATARRDRK